MMMLSIDTVPPIMLTEPDIINVSGVRRALGGESPVLTVTLDNARGHLTKLFSVPPLLARATLTGQTAALGVVQSCTIASTIKLTLET